MRGRIILITISAILLLAAGSVVAGQAAKGSGPDKTEKMSALSPQAVFHDTEYQFATLFEGEAIKHDFVIENKGQAPLVIKNVRPD